MADELPNTGPAFGTVSKIIDVLDPLSATDREHIMRTVAIWFRMGIAPEIGPIQSPVAVQTPQLSPRQTTPDDDKFSGRPVLSAKEFIFEKDPITEVERLACLAFYLTHYQDMPHFKNIDLSRLNIEAAQRKLSNPAVSINNAMRDGFFVQATEAGYKQLSAMGERFVQLLPDRDAASKVRERMSSRRGKKSGSQADVVSSEPESSET